MGSSRFPGKSMAILLKKPVIQWVLERVKLVRGPKRAKILYILAVPDEPESEPMLEIADKLKVDNFCGSELNVLKRYYDAARYFELDFVVRITGDCPFIDPVVCSEVIQLLVWRKLDYASNVYPTRSYPKGLDCEAFTMDALEASYKMADQLNDYEHVTAWLQRTNEIKKGLVKQAVDMSHKNWCIDYPEDIKRLEDEINLKIVADNTPTHIIGRKLTVGGGNDN